MTVQTRRSYGAPLPWSVVDENFTSLQDGVDAAAVATDLSSNEVGKGAATIGISPIAGVSATSVQAAIAELANDVNALAAPGGASFHARRAALCRARRGDRADSLRRDGALWLERH